MNWHPLHTPLYCPRPPSSSGIVQARCSRRNNDGDGSWFCFISSIRLSIWPVTLLLLILFNLRTAFAFSPYEQYLMSGRETHVGLLARLETGKLADFELDFRKCGVETVAEELSAAGISDLQAFTRMIEGTNYAVIYFSYAAGSNYLDAATAFEKATQLINWSETTAAHPRAKTYGRHWLQMEWINFIRGVHVDRKPTSTLMIATTVIPEMEFQYRSLHQTTWPGVVDQAVRGNIHNLSIYLVELDDELVEFLYLEYMGTDSEADDAANKADPINQRWWKLTDACQKPFSDVKEGNWTEMLPVR